MKKLIPTICMFLVAACLLGTSTFAWFSMNTTVTASGMSVKAKADGGLAIATYTGTDLATAPVSTAFSSAATSANTATAEVKPTSTANCTNWFKAISDDVSSSAANTAGYLAIDTDNKYYAEHKFQVKSLDPNTATTPASIYVYDVTVTGGTTGVELNKALRVAVKYGDNIQFFAPCYDAISGTMYRVSSTGTKVTATDLKTDKNTTAIGTVNTTASDLFIYIYFEGEDENCKSINTYTLDTLAVSVKVSTTQPTAA